jgi:hypothetical protein
MGIDKGKDRDKDKCIYIESFDFRPESDMGIDKGKDRDKDRII